MNVLKSVTSGYIEINWMFCTNILAHSSDALYLVIIAYNKIVSTGHQDEKLNKNIFKHGCLLDVWIIPVIVNK